MTLLLFSSWKTYINEQLLPPSLSQNSAPQPISPQTSFLQNYIWIFSFEKALGVTAGEKSFQNLKAIQSDKENTPEQTQR